jgi:hypothetical protein
LIEKIGQKRMEKISQNDALHFESSKMYPAFKAANEHLLKKAVTSLYN